MNPLRPKTLTRKRIVLAMAIALAADAFQVALGPFGWTFFDEVVDVIAMILISLLLGFHPLLLPTFVVELFPLVDMLPTWTGCVGAVILMRKRSQRAAPPVTPPVPPPVPQGKAQPPQESSGPVIDV